MIVFDHISKIYDSTAVVLDLCFEVNPGETLVLLGTSGSGKTTTMKMINRLIDPTSGKIYIDNEDIMTVDPITLRRKIGYAVQHIGLFNYMTVAENISVVPKLLKWEQARIDARVDDLLKLVGLDPDEYRDRYPGHLSGGQKQRIGVARALAQDPPIILMDEPFGALDPITREQLQNEFIELETDIKKTVVFVTHDVFEAVKMGDRIALIDDGKILQIATPAELIKSPANEFVDQFLGQHRFQLTLLTQTLKSFDLVKEEGEELNWAKTPNRLSSRFSMTEALDLFNKTKKLELPVFEGRRYLGRLRKKELLKRIVELLQEKEEEE